LALSTASSCGEGEPACSKHPLAYDGAMSGTLRGVPFTASIQVSTRSVNSDSVWYDGTFTGTGASAGQGGSFFFEVNCSAGIVVELKGWYIDDNSEDYPRGELEGGINSSNGSGTWSCTYGCTDTGTWIVHQ
jgi:hypothetical protein